MFGLDLNRCAHTLYYVMHVHGGILSSRPEPGKSPSIRRLMAIAFLQNVPGPRKPLESARLTKKSRRDGALFSSLTSTRAAPAENGSDSGSHTRYERC